jgi:phage gpG-like protein|uniref:phage virion morphogenesis protein n=1 Tax=Prevotella sp. TaxID=59823 RepID=UPI004024DDC6
MAMASADGELRKVVRRILSDIRVELGDEFDQNFERQGFFAEKWQRRKSPIRGDGHILVASGDLRKSIRSRSDESSITFYSDLAYAGIHNEGGEIKVTARMKRFFWHKYYETKDEFWKAMALMKVGKTIKIPRRQFLGMAPEVETEVRKIIEDNLTQYFEHDFNINTK